ncbi:uncharacterized protein LOC135826731 [Sycon ciliatum]|uniref:uncharacterized protein LOC135826731 n=1 Tax=Sycon ciliatum TaxID=27933 RepID=UPI0020A91CFF|eukprot:scpid63315/ scgid32256/ Cycloeucalenol cycloisomerase; Cycloeucalenol--obtusifoliol isomerase; Cyclopropyl sterol isomerase
MSARQNSNYEAENSTSLCGLIQSSNASKRWGECFFLIYSCFWVALMALVVLTQLYEFFESIHYVLFASFIALPAWVVPLLIPGCVDEDLPLSSRYVFKANVYIAVLAITANYFYTHYFYRLLDVRYVGPLAPGRGLSLNGVPISMYIMTHPYFCLYHTVASATLRVQRRLCDRYLGGKWLKSILTALLLGMFCTSVAFMETWTISSFPYYTYKSPARMFTVGTIFYALLFLVTFPMFSRLDEGKFESWTMGRVVVEALATMMLVLWVADLWRIAFMPAARIVLPPMPY